VHAQIDQTTRANRDRKDRAATSCEHFVAHQMQAQCLRGGPVEVECFHCLAHVCAQLLLGIGLRDDAFAEGLGDEAAVGLLGNGKNEFVHGLDGIAALSGAASLARRCVAA